MKAVISLLCLIGAVCWGASYARLEAVSTTETYTHDASGLEKEFGPFFEAYSKGDVAAQDQAISVFRVPDAKGWFEQSFRAEDVEQLMWDDETAVSFLGKNFLARGMDMVARGALFHAKCEAQVVKKEGPVKPRASSMNPVKDVNVEQFNIEIHANESEKLFSFLGNFVYVNGAYRYVGGGALPFWSMPGGTHPKEH
jgi:hypothetical protein